MVGTSPLLLGAWHTSRLIAQPAGTNDTAIRCHPQLPHPGVTCCCDAGGLHRTPATTGAPWKGQIKANMHRPLGATHGQASAVTSQRGLILGLIFLLCFLPPPI